MRIAPALMNHVDIAQSRVWPCGLAKIDATLSGGFAYGRVHEVWAASVEDGAAMTGFGLALANGMAEERPLLWLRSRRAVGVNGIVQGHGWAELGLNPAQMLIGVLPDTLALLKAAVDALRSAALGAVIIESRGAMRELDLTASRRLALAAEKSGVPLFLLRFDAEPAPSAAQTRWQVAAAPSRALPGNAPGWPVFDVELLRQKAGPSGLGWRLEWDRDARQFRDAAQDGAVVPVPFRRPAADAGAGSRQNARRAA